MILIIRTNAGKRIGLGHLFRCISLAQAIKLQDGGIKVIFFSNVDSEIFIKQAGFEFVPTENFDNTDISNIKSFSPDMVVLDSYNASNNYLKLIKNFSRLVLFDDNNDIYDSAIPDLIINGNIHAYKLGYPISKNHLLGPKYLVMRREYWNSSNGINDVRAIERLLITTGGTDYKKVTIKFIKELKNIPILKRIIIGAFFEKSYIEEIEREVSKDRNYELIYKPWSLKKYIEESDVVLTASGTTVYEVLTLSRIPIIFTYADNQNIAAMELKNRGVAYIGAYNNIDYDLLRNLIISIYNSYDKERRKLKSLFELFDGNGAFRVSEKLLEFIKQ